MTEPNIIPFFMTGGCLYLSCFYIPQYNYNELKDLGISARNRERLIYQEFLYNAILTAARHGEINDEWKTFNVYLLPNTVTIGENPIQQVCFIFPGDPKPDRPRENLDKLILLYRKSPETPSHYFSDEAYDSWFRLHVKSFPEWRQILRSKSSANDPT